MQTSLSGFGIKQWLIDLKWIILAIIGLVIIIIIDIAFTRWSSNIMDDVWAKIYFKFAGALVVAICVIVILRIIVYIMERPLIRPPLVLQK